MVGSAKIIVAIPVKNEEDRIGICIAALAAQSQPFDTLLLHLNNCTDGTYAACREAGSAPNIRIVQYKLPPRLASAGEARRLALDHASEMDKDAIVLTTDADAVPGPEWIARNVAGIMRGADMVCGQACLLPEDKDRLPPRLHRDDMLETSLLDLLDEIDNLVNPDAFDPWPRHQHNSGASIAMRANTLRRAGGAPHISTGEDRALVARFRHIDARIRHDPEIIVPVSGRLEGRAENGMAATLKRRITLRDELTDERLEPAVDFYRRSLAKAELRATRLQQSGPARISADLLIDEATVLEALHGPYFGAAWEIIQAASPVLKRRRVAFANINREIQQATQLRDMLRRHAGERQTRHVATLAVG